MRRLGFSPNLFACHGCAMHRLPVHRGVTLLEVMFAIGIVAVGLLGVLIIVPLAGLRSTQGAIADSADRIGRSAIRAFDVYQMRRPDAWAQLYPGSLNYYPYPENPQTGLQPSSWPSPYWPNQAMPWQCGFCIDPIYLASNTTNPATPGIQRFPYFAPSNLPTPGTPWMLRVSLRTRPGAIDTSTMPNPVPAMTISQAEQLFLGGDDLVFQLPSDRTLPSQQVFHGFWRASTNYSMGTYCQPTVANGWGYRVTSAGTSGSSEPAPWPTVLGATIMDGTVTWECRPLVKRQWEGKFSWLATVVPKRNYDSDTYVLSIVVFHRRDLALDAERMINVAFNSNGYNGGDVVLQAAAADDLKMKEGEWLMLAGTDSDVVPYQYYFHWYRIQTADAGPEEVSTGVWERHLTLFGADWPGQDWATPVIDVCKAVWTPGVVAVYEKTIRLETSSLWTDL